MRSRLLSSTSMKTMQRPKRMKRARGERTLRGTAEQHPFYYGNATLGRGSDLGFRARRAIRKAPGFRLQPYDRVKDADTMHGTAPTISWFFVFFHPRRRHSDTPLKSSWSTSLDQACLAGVAVLA